MRRIAPLLVALAIASAPVALAAPASAAPASDIGLCEVSDGELTWGYKESFRSYISGTIANGTWEVIEPATYETPVFTWPAAGTAADTSGAVSIAYAGGVHFTGHDGLLDAVIENPTLVIAADASGRAESAQILLDLRNVTMEDALAGDDDVQVAEQVPFIDLDLSQVDLPAPADGVVVEAEAVPAAITQEGFDAFGTYERGTDFDPVSFSFTVECPAPEPAPAEAETEAAPGVAEQAPTADDRTDAVEADDGWAITPIVGAVAGVVLIAGIAVAIWLVVRRRGRGAHVDGADDVG